MYPRFSVVVSLEVYVEGSLDPHQITDCVSITTRASEIFPSHECVCVFNNGSSHLINRNSFEERAFGAVMPTGINCGQIYDPIQLS
jgi:hypothetical protein